MPDHFILLEHLSAGAVLVETPEWGIQKWILGFTYKTWTCAATGETIQRGENAWRPLFPLDAENAKLRIAEHVFLTSDLN